MRHAFSRSTWIAFLCTIPALAASPQQAWEEARYFPTGTPIYSNGYCDQPYVITLPDGCWLCTFTTDAAAEGGGGQHIVASRSTDLGKSWTEPVKIEPETGPSASWAMPFLTDFGRVYVFYDYNGDQIYALPQAPTEKIRDDMLGWYCFKYSDDGGLSWSERHRLPVRVTACDRANQWGGAVHILWGIGKPQALRDGAMIFGFTKLGQYMLDEGEGWFFRCDNINAERDPKKLCWQNLPLGDHGLRNPDFESVQEEHNLVELSDGSLYCVYRTAQGFIAYATSKDQGQSWSLPQALRYATGEIIPNPRACPRLFKCSNGRFLLWFENHHGQGVEFRNPAWLSGGVENAAGEISWSQPEILLYSDDTSYHSGRFSYPDLIEQEGKYWITCTNKVATRIFPIDPTLLQDLWTQVDLSLKKTASLPTPDAEFTAQDTTLSLADWTAKSATPGFWLLPEKRTESLTLRFTLRLDKLDSNQVIFDARDKNGTGLVLKTGPNQRVQFRLKSGGNKAIWQSDAKLIKAGKTHQLTLILDNGPGIVMGIVDGKCCDGDKEDWGWKRYRDLDAIRNHRLSRKRPAPRSLGPVPLNEEQSAVVNPHHLLKLSLYNRALRVSEVVLLDEKENAEAVIK